VQTRIVAAAAAILFLAGCGGPKPEVPQHQGANKPDTSNIKIDGDRDAPVNKLAIEAIADLQDFWGKEFPTLYNEDYKPVAGGFFASTPDSESGPKCASSFADVSGNAFYCKLDDSVAWDADGLLPELQQKYGDFVIPIVLAHEWGHAVQQRSGFFDENKITVSSELQADCFAGAWAKHAQDDKVFDVSSGDLDTAVAGILSLKDSAGTTSENTQDAHGSGFDRVSAFQDGYDNTVEKCKGYKDGDPVVLELPFTDEEDAARGGDAPYDEIVNKVPYDMEDYWTQLYPEITEGQAWTPLKGLEPFDPSSPPECGGQSVKGYRLFYCVPDDFIGWDNVDTLPKIYARSGDYAVATELATQYGLAALDRLGDKSEGKTSSLRGDCLAGSYTASVMLQNRKATSSYSISPGDLDEGIEALLIPIDKDAENTEGQGTGFERTRAFRAGVIDGAGACLKYGE
jgi:predicted metalloprotease